MNSLDLLIVAAAVGGGARRLPARASWPGSPRGSGWPLRRGASGARCSRRILDALDEGSADRSCSSSRSACSLGAAFIGQAARAARRAAAPRRAARAAAVRSGRPGGGRGGRRGRRGRSSLWLLLPAHGRRAGLVRRPGAHVHAGRGRRRALPGAARHRRPRSGASSATTSSPGCSTPCEPAPDLGPPPAATGHPPGGRRRGGAVHGEGARAWPAAASRRAAGSWSAPAWSSPTRTWWPASARPSSQRSDGSEVDGRPSWPSTRAATSPSSARPDLDRPALAAGRRRARATSGAVFGHPGGGPLRAAPFAGRAARSTATGTDIYDREPHRARRADPGVGPAPGRLGRRPHRPARAGWSAWPSPSPRTSRAWPTPSPSSELEAVLAGDLSRPVDTGPCLR